MGRIMKDRKLPTADTMPSSSKWFSSAIPVLSLLVAALSLLLSLFLAVRSGQLASLYLALDLQQKRPFLAPVIQSKQIQGDERYIWSWGARNSGAVIARLLYADQHERIAPTESWNGSGRARDEIIYPGETIELLGERGKFSGGLAVTCIVYEEVKRVR